MKKMNAKIKKLSACLLTLILLFSALTVTAFAEDDDSPYRKWTMNEDMTVLSDGAKEYRYVDIPIGVFMDFYSSYYFENSVEIGNYDATVTSSGRGVNLYEVYYSYESYIYADAEIALKINSFLCGEYSKWRLVYYDNSSEKVIDESFVSLLKSKAATERYSVRALKDLTQYHVTAHDSTDSFYVELGIIYRFDDGSYKYLDLSELDNSYFDASGKFSYRTGSVKLREISGEALSELESSIDDLAYPDYDYEYEEDDYEYEGEPGFVVKLFFWAASLTVGILLPAAAIAVGIILPRTKKLHGKKYWQTLSIIGAVWLVLGLIFLLIVII